MALANEQQAANAAENRLSEICLDPKRPPEVRAKILFDVLQSNDEPEAQQAVLTDLFRQAVSGGDAEALRLMENYEQGLAELQQGPVRAATFLAPAEGNLPGPEPRVHVVTADGQERYPTLHPRVPLAELRPGMTVFLDARGSVVLGTSGTLPRVGQEGTFLRRLAGSNLLEATVQNDRLVVHAAAPVLEALAKSGLKHGDRLLVCPRRHVAFAVVPPEKDLTHRFVERARMPEVIAERDIGAPHWVLDYLVRRLRVFLFRPDLLGSFDLRPRVSVMLTGPSGCGKTLTIRAFLHELGRMLEARTGLRDLGSRVVRVKIAELLSEWLGRSDKNIEELFDDVHALASEEVLTASGERVRLPVVVVLEEVEGMARRRGEQDTVYDRILTTLLQRLDDPTEDLGRLPLVLISTTNRPDLIDSAMCRRLGLPARFTRLDREGATAVLDKKLRPHYPYAATAGQTKTQARADVLSSVVRWLFGPGGETQGVVEIALSDGKEVVKRRRDFLTGGLIEMAVATAIDRAVTEAQGTEQPAGLSAAVLIAALRQHVDGLADNLTPVNVADYLDLPENHRVTAVRRLRGSLPPYLEDLDD